MADYYPDKDVWLRPITINSANRVVSVTEDPNGSNDTFSVQLEQTSSSDVDGPYYPTASDDPIAGDTDNSGNAPTPVPSTKILDATNDKLTVTHLYDHIVDKLTANSPNNLTYEMTADTPSGSSQTNSGVTVTTSSGSTDIQLNLAASNHISGSVFGWGDTERSVGGSASITGPESRGIIWYSPVLPHEKPRLDRYEGFDSGPDARPSRQWRYTDRQRERLIQYKKVPAVHVHAFDRASKSDQQSAGGVPAGDSSNAFEDFWDAVGYADRDIIIAHHTGPGSGSMSLRVGTVGPLTVCKLSGDFADRFAPHEQSGRSPTEYPLEHYDLSIKIAEADPSSYGPLAFPYRH